MSTPELSAHFAGRKPSAIRTAQIEFMKRTDKVEAVNTAIGNVTLPMHPAMQKRMRDLCSSDSPFADGVVGYSATVGTAEAQQAMLQILASSGADTKGLFVQITDGGSAAMELVALGVCGPAGTQQKPLLLIDAAYTNYKSFAERIGRATVSVQRNLGKDGKFTLPDMAEIEAKIKAHNPGALVVIPYDNPTGHFYDQATMAKLAKLCVQYNLWLVSDEAYRELYYVEGQASTVWRITENDVPGITGRRISIDTASKVWNACGLRIGALVTDSQDFHTRSVAEYTANLCANVIGQHIFAVLAKESVEDLQKWYGKQRAYYRELMTGVYQGLKTAQPKLIVSSPDASIYTVVDVRDVAKPGFDAMQFVLYCAQKGKVDVNGKAMTLLVSPMTGFYQVDPGKENPGKTQMRIAFVETPEKMALVPRLFTELLAQYEASR